DALDAASQVPWVLLSGGVDDATFEAQVEVACRAGASGVLAGRSVWEGAASAVAPAGPPLPRSSPADRCGRGRRRSTRRPGMRSWQRPAATASGVLRSWSTE